MAVISMYIIYIIFQAYMVLLLCCQTRVQNHNIIGVILISVEICGSRAVASVKRIQHRTTGLFSTKGNVQMGLCPDGIMSRGYLSEVVMSGYSERHPTSMTDQVQFN